MKFTERESSVTGKSVRTRQSTYAPRKRGPNARKWVTVSQNVRGKGLRKVKRREPNAYVVMTLNELWDLPATVAHLATLPLGHQDIRAVKQAIDFFTGNEKRKHMVKYKYSIKSGLDFGRAYSESRKTNKTAFSFQHVTSRTRNACGASLSRDFDAVNCFPTIFLQILQKLGIECEPLKQYST